ncbi:MAG: gliding motility-associated C-terminal domain-containing protein [Bacteroidales bacterium]|nr:gliding motility-associated C-terminal domain-containing protein [Bacteroidales bacterium]
MKDAESHVTKGGPRRGWATLVIVSLLLTSWAVHAEDTLSFRLTAVNEENNAALRWTNLGEGVTYRVYRRLPQEEDFVLRRTTTDYTMTDGVNVTICDDSVIYRVECTIGSTPYRSNSQGVYFTDDLPTSSCSLRTASVDTTTQLLILTWNTSPDPDIWGYVIHKKDNNGRWMAYDTVWGKTNTRYVGNGLPVDSLHAFRIFAFDSCFQASPLTEPYHNVVLSASLPPCSRRISASWNTYDNMPGGVKAYYFMSQNDGGAWESTLVNSPNKEYDIPATVRSTRVMVMVVPNTPSDTVFSNIVSLEMMVPDSADYISLDEATVADDNSAVILSGKVDASFQTDGYALYRRTQSGAWYHLATLPYTGNEDLYYIDRQARPSSESFLYRLGVRGGCLGNETFSDSVANLLIRIDTTLSATSPDILWDEIPNAISYTLAKYSDGADTCYRVVAQLPTDTIQSNLLRHAPKVRLFLPNAFIPGQGANGIFRPASPNVSSENYSLLIFNRYGQQIFSTHDPTEGWDGTMQGKPAPAASYAYVVFFMSGGKRQEQAGTVTLIR